MGRKLDEDAAEGGRGRQVLSRVIRGLGPQQQPGDARVWRGRGGDDAGKVASGLGELAQLEVGLGQPVRRVPARRARGIHFLRQLVLCARVIPVSAEPVRLPLQQDGMRAHTGRERRAQQLLDERRYLRRLFRIDQDTREADLERHDQRRATRLQGADHVLRAVGIGGEQREGEPRLDPLAFGAPTPRRRQVRAKSGRAIKMAVGRQVPPTEPRPTHLQQRVRPPPDEQRELTNRSLVLAGAPEGLTEPERNVARERSRRALRRERCPCRHRLVVPTERVVGKPEAVPRPGLQHGRRRRLELCEGVARPGHLVEPERGPAARMQAPDCELRGPRATGDLTEERVRLLESVEPIVGLGEPVTRFRHEVAIRAAADRRFEILGRVEVLALGVVRTPALEGLRHDTERRTDTCEGARRTEGGSQLVGRRRHDGRQRHRRELRG